MRLNKLGLLIFVLVTFFVFTLVGCTKKENISLSVAETDKNIALEVGNEKKVIPTVTGAVTLNWSSSNQTIVSVNDGLLKALKAGSAVITITINDHSDISVKITVTVTDPVVEFKAQSLKTILTNGKNNDNVMIEGVVYGVVKNGFYVADSEDGKAFVVMGSDWEANVQIGDKVQVTGQFGYSSNFPQIKTVTKVEVVSNNNTSYVSTVNGTIEDINKLDRTARTGVYAKEYKLQATVGKNAAGIYTLADDYGKLCYVNNNSNINVLDEFLDKRVELCVIVHGYSVSDNRWQVSFVGENSDIVLSALSFDTLLETATKHIESVVSKNVYGVMELPSGHENISYLKYTWTVNNNDYINIVNNVATIIIDDEDHNVTLKVSVTDGVSTEIIEYPVLLKGIVERSVASLDDGDLVTNYSVVKVRAIVVGFARNQSESIRSLIIMDKTTKDTITIDFGSTSTTYLESSSDEYKNVKVGDEIIVTGSYRNTSRVTIMNPISLEVVSNDNKVSHDFDGAYVLNNKESYDTFAANYDNYINKLVKFENPFLNYSTSSTPTNTNWVRLGYNETSGDASYDGHYFAFLIAAQNESLGTDSWHKMYEIPFVGTGARQVDLTIYAYPLYISETYIAFVIPDQSCFIASDIDQIKIDLEGQIPTSIEKGTITLPLTSELCGNIVWTSSNEAINVENGEVTASETENIDVVLTATFTLNDKEEKIEFVVTVLKDSPMTVTELLSNAKDSQTVKVTGIIVGYIDDGNNNVGRQGVLLMDSITNKVVLVSGVGSLGGKHGAYIDSEGNELILGDEVQIVGTYYLNTGAIGSGPAQTGRNYIEVTANDKIKLLSSDNSITVKEEVVISSNQMLSDFANSLQYGIVIKLIGTKENPICIGGSSTSSPFNIKVFMNTEAIDNNGTKYGDAKIFSLKSDCNAYNANGEDWYKTLFGIEGPFVGPNTSITPIKYIGEMYVVVGFQTGTYIQMSILNYSDTKLTRYVEPSEVGSILIKDLPTILTSGDLEIELPTTFSLIDGDITWVADKTDIINLTTNKVAYVDEDTEVKLTASYKIDGADYSVDYIVKVLKTISKVELEAELLKDIPTEVIRGALDFTLKNSVLGIENIVWTSSNNEVLDLESMTALVVSTDTIVTLTATYTLRGEVTTSTKDITVSSKISLDDVKTALVTGYPTSVVAGQIDLLLNVSHPDVTGAVVWSSSSKVIDLNTMTATTDTEVKVTLTGTFTYMEQTETVTYELTVKPYHTVSELLTNGKDNTPVKVNGVIFAFISDGNTTIDRLGVAIYELGTSSVLLVQGLSNIGGEYGAYLDSDGNSLNIGDEITLTGVYYLNSEKIGTSGPEQIGRKYLSVSATDTIKQVSTENDCVISETVTITNNDELASFAENIKYGTVVKIVGTTENPICLGGSSSKNPFNIKVFMNKNATVNDDTKYSSRIFSLKSDVNVANGGDNWYNDSFGISGPFVGPKDAQLPILYTGTIYVLIAYQTSTYFQMSIVNYANWSVTKIL